MRSRESRSSGRRNCFAESTVAWSWASGTVLSSACGASGITLVVRLAARVSNRSLTWHPPCSYSTLFHARWCATGAWSTGGEVAFRKDVLSFANTKDGRYSPPEERNSLFSWHISPLFDFATSNVRGQEPHL